MTRSTSAQVSIAATELPAFQATMRDAQTAAADYYGQTARGVNIDDLGTPVRRFLIAAQTVNERLTHGSDAATYKGIISGSHPGASVIRGVKYARNVVEHVSHVIQPGDEHIVIGGVSGLRIYSFWDEIPDAVHAKLHKGTQKLRPDYNASLLGTNVTETMLDTLSFFSDVAPSIPHRDSRGEWTGFPLMDQPGVRDRLHPEEPSEEVAARAWLNGRRPNGDVRVICGQVTLDGIRYVFGLTFVGALSYAPFIETAEQFRRDTTAGYPYVVGDASKNTVDCTASIPHFVQGSVFQSLDSIETWTTAAPSGGWEKDWVNEETADTWHRLVAMEHSNRFPVSFSYPVRRARRLNALVPYSP